MRRRIAGKAHIEMTLLTQRRGRKLSEKGYRRRSERGFRQYTDTKMPLWRPLRLPSQAHPRLFRQFRR